MCILATYIGPSINSWRLTSLAAHFLKVALMNDEIFAKLHIRLFPSLLLCLDSNRMMCGLLSRHSYIYNNLLRTWRERDNNSGKSLEGS